MSSPVSSRKGYTADERFLLGRAYGVPVYATLRELAQRGILRLGRRLIAKSNGRRSLPTIETQFIAQEITGGRYWVITEEAYNELNGVQAGMEDRDEAVD